MQPGLDPDRETLPLPAVCLPPPSSPRHRPSTPRKSALSHSLRFRKALSRLWLLPPRSCPVPHLSRRTGPHSMASRPTLPRPDRAISGLRHSQPPKVAQSQCTLPDDQGMPTGASHYSAGPAGDQIPHVEVTKASPSGSWTSEPQPVRQTIYSMANEPLATAPQSHADSRYSTARQSIYSTAGTQLGDGTWHTAQRDSTSSYHSAPQPVPAKYGSAIEHSEDDAPIRYQLHDRDVQWGTASQGRSTTGEGDYLSARPPTSRMTTAETQLSSAYRSALSTASPRSSEYESAPPPPISHSSTGSEQLSYRSDVQEQAETATHISEPESDVGLLADLERRSSFGSMAPDAAARRSMRTKTYYTANETMATARTPLGTAQMNTMYETARDSAYTTAASWTTPATTAQGTQE